ncbi:uncharacterized protein LOC143057776 [Mytilus galloprovincialis]|uniref:uncharacterized protein LOC143057776 n=1 Tax=Mytilus galloprovincialis TaxID=29158 RepID=UPI003F7CB135
MLVNTVGTDLNLKNGIVSNLILERAGGKIQEECYALKPKGIVPSGVIVTTAGYMKNCKSICHGALTGWHHRSGLSLQVLRIIMWQCLTVADNRQYKSVAFPAFGTGKLHYPSRQVAETMIDIIYKFGVIYQETSLRDIQIVLHSKDTGNIQVFQTAFNRWNERKQSSAGNDRQHLDILECKVPAEYGNVRVQVWPMAESVEGDLICYFDQSFYKEPELKLKANGSLQGKLSTFPTYDSGLEHILMWVEKYRVTELSLVFDKKQKDPESFLKTVKEKIFRDESDRGYLEVVKIFVEESQLNSLLTKPPKGEEKGGFIEYFKKKAGIKRHRGSTAWIKTIPQSQRTNYMVTITGNQDKVNAAKKEITSFLNKKELSLPQKHKLGNQQQQRWALKKNKKTGIEYIPLSEEVCKSIAFSTQKGQTKTEFPHKEGIWIYDAENNVCYDKKQNTVFELVKMDERTPIEGSNVDPVMIPKSKILKTNDEPFTSVKAEIRYGTANLKTRRAIEDFLTHLDIRFNKLSTGKWEVECSSLDELENLNSLLSKKFETEQEPVLSYAQKTTTEKNYENQFQKTHTKATPMSNKSNVITFELEEREYAMLKHFCSKSKILNGRCEYKDGSLKRMIEAYEKEADLKSDFATQKTFIASLSSSDISFENGISDEKLHEIERNVADSGDIFCYLSSNRKMITLYGSNYEKLGEGRHKAEICLGLKQQSKGRRNRVFVTDTDLSTTKKEQTSAEQTVRRPTDFSRSVSASSGPRTEMTFKTSEGLIIKVYNGNILSLNVDCIVNAANENLNHGGGVAYVIAAAAGYDFEKESDDYILQHGPIKEGSCCSTSAGKLRYKSVIHTVGPKWYTYNDKTECCRVLRKSVECCFFEAEVNGMSSVAIPSISAGIFGVPKEVCCKEYGKAVEDFSRKNGYKTCLKEIHFIDKDAGMISMIQKEFSQNFNQISSSNTGSSNSGSFTAGGERRITRSLSSPDDSEVSKEKTQNRQDNFAGSMSKFQKQFMAATDLKVSVVQDDIIKRKVSTIVCPQDEKVSNKGGIARAIEEVCDDKYRQSVKTLNWISKCDIRKVKASPSSLSFQYVLHTVPPRYDKIAEAYKSSFNNDLEVTIRNILRHCSDKGDVTSVAMPVLGIGKDGLETPVSTFAKIFLLVLLGEIKSTHKFDVKEIHIVTNDISAAVIVADELEKEKSFTKMTSFSRTRNKGNAKPDTTQDIKMAMAGKTFRGALKDGEENCAICMEPNTKPRELTCGHVFCENCVQRCFEVKPVCPTCGSIQGVIKGDQPPGRMIRREMGYSLPTFKCNTIELEYEIYPGTQGEEHPNPGKPFKGIKRVGYFPNNTKGKLIADLLKIAFDRKLVFTIGHSRTTGQEGVVTWNDIHHKTSSSYKHQFGYPDEGYFDRVLDELKIKGVTEKDLKY